MSKILLIEDEISLRNTLEMKLKEMGHEIITADDGQQGIETAREKKPDLVVLDLMMPKKNGIEFLKEVREDSELKDLAVVVLTNSDNPEHIQQVLDFGASTYLVKSNYSLLEVLEKIQKILTP